jgi:signal transduction histidine kinase
VEALRADGQRIELEASISKATVGGETVLTAILRDITDRTRAERALVQYQMQLAGLAHRLLAQEKDTTQKLAQALHDDLGQTLAALRLIFEADRKRMETELAQPIWTERMERLIIEANKQARKVLTDLRPPQLDEHGLLAALDNELQQRQKNHGQIAFRMEGAALPHGIRWPSEVEYAAFMVAREAINNALLHAAPAAVVVQVQGDAGHLLLTISDDGKGIADLTSLERIGHLGVIGMRERATAIGARLEVQSSTESGTRISLQWGSIA